MPVDEALADQFTVLKARLKESEENYRNLFKNMSEGFAVCEMLYDEAGKPVDYRFLNVNPVFEKFLGLSRDQIIGKTIRDHRFPMSQPNAIETFGKVVSTGEPVHFENYSRDLNKWFDVYAYRSNPGQFGYMVIDITERKKAEGALKESEARFRSVLDSSRDVIVRFNVQTGHYEYVSPSVEALVGYSAEEFKGMDSVTALAMVHPDDLPVLRSATAVWKLPAAHKQNTGKRLKTGTISGFPIACPLSKTVLVYQYIETATFATSPSAKKRMKSLSAATRK